MPKNPLKIAMLKEEYSDSMRILKESSLKTTYYFDFKEKGNGKMVCYEIFPGIYFTYVEFHTFTINDFFKEVEKTSIEINHCKKGRYECKLHGKYLYLEEGDLVATTKASKAESSGFTLGYYEGIEIFIDKEIAKHSLKNILGYSFNLEELYQKIAENDDFILIRSTDEIEHIFSELYNVDKRIQETYFKLKVLELFLFLKIAPLNNKIEDKPHFSQKQVNAVKEIKKQMVDNITMDITLEDLSKEYGISVTSLKSCFKAVYGKPLFNWRKEYKLQLAGRLLKETNENITEIATKIGYKNPSKFSSAFKSYYNLTPSEFRKRKI